MNTNIMIRYTKLFGCIERQRRVTHSLEIIKYGFGRCLMDGELSTYNERELDICPGSPAVLFYLIQAECVGWGSFVV